MYLQTLFEQTDIAFRLRSVGLCLASPTNIKKWAFKFDSAKQSNPLTGRIKNAKTVNYKTLLPEKGGLFCPTVFGRTKSNQRHRLGYLKLAAPIAHLWYLKATPSYLSLLLNKKRKVIQNLVYTNALVSFSQQTFRLERLENVKKKLSRYNVNALINFETAKPQFNQLPPYKTLIPQSQFKSLPCFFHQNKNFIDINNHTLNLPLNTSFPFDYIIKNNIQNRNSVFPFFSWTKRILSKPNKPNTNKTSKTTKTNKMSKTAKTTKTNKTSKTSKLNKTSKTSQLNKTSKTSKLNKPAKTNKSNKLAKTSKSNKPAKTGVSKPTKTNKPNTNKSAKPNKLIKANKPSKLIKTNKINKTVKISKTSGQKFHCNKMNHEENLSNVSFYSIAKKTDDYKLILKQNNASQNLNIQDHGFNQNEKLKNLCPILQHFYEVLDTKAIYNTVESPTCFITYEKLNPSLRSYYGLFNAQPDAQYQNYFWLIYAQKNLLKLVFFFNLTHQIKLYRTLQRFLQLSIKKSNVSKHIRKNSQTIINLLGQLNKENNVNSPINKQLKYLTNSQLKNSNTVLFKQKVQQNLNSNLNLNSFEFLNQDFSNAKKVKWLGSKWANTYLNQTINGLQVSVKIKHGINFKLKTVKVNLLFLKAWLKNKKIKIKQWKLLKETSELLHQTEAVLYQLPSQTLIGRALNLNAYLTNKPLPMKRQKIKRKPKFLKKAHQKFSKKARLKKNKQFKTISKALTYDLNKSLLYVYPHFLETTMGLFWQVIDAILPLMGHPIEKIYTLETWRKPNVAFCLPIANCYPVIELWMLYYINGTKWLTKKQQFFYDLRTVFVNAHFNQLKWRSSSKSLNHWLKNLYNQRLNENQRYRQTNMTINLNNQLDSRTEKRNNFVSMLKRKKVSLLKFQYDLQKSKMNQLIDFSNQYWFFPMALANRSDRLLDCYNGFDLETTFNYKKVNEFCFKKQLRLFKVVWHYELLRKQYNCHGINWRNTRKADAITYASQADAIASFEYEQVSKKLKQINAKRRHHNKKQIRKVKRGFIYPKRPKKKYKKRLAKRSFVFFAKGRIKAYTVKIKRKKKEEREIEEMVYSNFKKQQFFPGTFIYSNLIQYYNARFFYHVPKTINKEKFCKLLTIYLDSFKKANIFTGIPTYYKRFLITNPFDVTNTGTKTKQEKRQFKRGLKDKSMQFEIDYIPLTYRYNHIHKGYGPRNVNQKHLKNPLGHRNFRRFVKEKLTLSVKKSICISQLKHYSKSLLVEKVTLTSHLRKKTRYFDFGLNDDFNFLEKQRFIYFILIHLQTNVTNFLEKQKKMIDLNLNLNSSDKKASCKSWYSKLSQYQLHFLCPFERFNYFNNKQLVQEHLSAIKTINVTFIQKPLKSYNFLKVRLPFTDSLKKNPILNCSTLISIQKKSDNSMTSETLRFLPQFKKQKFFLNNQSLLLNKQNYIKLDKWQKMLWKNESDLFNRLTKLKNRLNSLLSAINHKVNLFLLASKPSLALDKKEVLGLKGKVPKFVKPEMWNSDDFPHLNITGLKYAVAYFQAKQQQRLYGQKVILKKLRIDFKQKPYKIVDRCANYFSLKTKIVKAKSVRLLLAYRLITRFSTASANLKQLLWNLNLNLKSKLPSKKFDLDKSFCLLELDCLLYNRLNIRKRTVPKRLLQHFVGRRLLTFLHKSKLYKNSYYVIDQSFSWFSDYEYAVLNYYMSAVIWAQDFILPAYLERGIIVNRPKTGAWAIRSLLNKFQPVQEQLHKLHTGLIKLDSKRLIFQQYYKSLVARLAHLNEVVMNYKTLARKVAGKPLAKGFKSYKRIIGSNFVFPDSTRLINSVGTFPSKELILKFSGRYLNRMQIKRKIISRRLKVLTPWLDFKYKPAWMTLTLLPILPPSLRPILPLSGGQFAMADLNKLYQQVIYRNRRLRDLRKGNLTIRYAAHFMDFGLVLRFNYRLLQEAVDALMDNGKSDSKVVLNNQDQPLKSLSEGLRGKKGRFRQNLLGKRVDYSGRSVIVVGPQLQVHQCGLPKEMALELFQPFLIHQLLLKQYATTYTGAKKLIKIKAPIIWTVLKELMLSRPILLNRAPTLHRLGIQAFQPLLVSGRAILLHPLVCSAFNADFDGDQMAVHVPLSYDACSEAWKLMWSRNHLFSLATGEPNLTPTQDMVLGCYYLSTLDRIKNQLTFTEPNSWFIDLTDVLQAYDHNQLDLHQLIWLQWSSDVEFDLAYQPCLEFQLDNQGYQCAYYTSCCHYYERFYWIRTTVGRILLNQLIFDLIS